MLGSVVDPLHAHSPCRAEGSAHAAPDKQPRGASGSARPFRLITVELQAAARTNRAPTAFEIAKAGPIECALRKERIGASIARNFLLLEK
jgi:hypothetical protein